MILKLSGMARVVPLAGLVLGACVSGITIALTGCSFTASRDVLAYDTCVARHPQEQVLCEGPRQAYELDPTAFQATADAVSPPADSSYAQR
jgi:hypothetical protein